LVQEQVERVERVRLNADEADKLQKQKGVIKQQDTKK
jgi:hypothetical protein